MTGNALKQLTYGVYFLGTKKDGGVNGMVASWVTQASFEPRLVAVGVKKERYSHNLIEKGKVFSLCVLGKSYKDRLHLFKGDKETAESTISGVEFQKLETGAPVLKDCVGFMECRLVEAVQTGDHTLFIGEVINEGVNGGEPLTVADLEGHYYGG